MTFSVNHPILFLLAGIIILAVLAQSVFFLVRALRRGRQIGMDMQKLKKTMLTAGVFTIAPAVAIVISVITLSKDLGLPEADGDDGPVFAGEAHHVGYGAHRRQIGVPSAHFLARHTLQRTNPAHSR